MGIARGVGRGDEVKEGFGNGSTPQYRCDSLSSGGAVIVLWMGRCLRRTDVDAGTSACIKIIALGGLHLEGQVCLL